MHDHRLIPSEQESDPLASKSCAHKSSSKPGRSRHWRTCQAFCHD